MRLLLLVPLLALAGCDLVSPDAPRALITRVTLDAAPLLKPDGTRWDEGGLLPSDGDFSVTVRYGPDREFSFLPRLFSEDANEQVYREVGPYDFPLVFRPSEPIEVDGEASVYVAVFDDDLESDTYVGKTDAVALAAVLGEGVDGTATLESGDGTVRARLDVRWE